MTAKQRFEIANRPWLGNKDIAQLFDCCENTAGKIKQKIVDETKCELPHDKRIRTDLVLSKLGVTIDQLAKAARLEQELSTSK